MKRKKESPENMNNPELRKKDDIKESKRSRLDRRIAAVSYCAMVIMLCMIGYFAFFLATDNSEILSNPYNKRQSLLEKHVTRGKIISSDGKVLAETIVNKKGKEVRYYPYSNMFAHSVGHYENGKSGIESVYNYYMLTSSINPVYAAIDELQGIKKPGDNVISTLNVELQKTAYDALGNRKGAVIAMEPDTGNVLVMVSKSDFDPNFINSEWKRVIDDDENSPLLNRATQGLYPPGSTFKTVTLLEYMREHPDYKQFSFECDGSEEIGGLKINCYNKKKHGSLDLKSAYAKSCNGAFAAAGDDLSVKKFKKTCEELLFNNEIECDFAYKNSSFSLKKKASSAEKAQTAIGQGKTLMTPFHNAVITCAVCNEGYYVKAHLVDRIENTGGHVVKRFHHNKKEKLMTSNEASVISKYMKETVKSGTAAALASDSYEAFGKTGSAEYNSSGASHAWFTGYAKSGSKKIVVSIIVEGAGTGSDHAVPIAKKIFDAYY